MRARCHEAVEGLNSFSLYSCDVARDSSGDAISF